jgi:hypothetical protein
VHEVEHVAGVVAGVAVEYPLGEVDRAARVVVVVEGAADLGLVPLPDHILTDEAYRVRVATRLSNPAVRRYWLETFDAKDARYRAEAIEPVLTRVSDFGIVPLMQRIVGQAKSGFDSRAVMDERKILIANLDVGLIGEENAKLLGALLLTKYELAARGRSEAGAALPDHHLYVDRFDCFPNERWPSILSGVGAYGLCLTVAHQYGEQLSDTTRSAVYGSVGSTIAFRTGQADAEELAKHYRRDLSEPQFTGLDDREINVRLLVGGKQEVFQGKSLPFEATPYGHKAAIIERSRQEFGVPLDGLGPRAPLGRRERRLLAAERVLRSRPKLSPESPTAKAWQIIHGERRTATPQNAPTARPHSATESRTDLPSAATRGSSPETAQARFRRKFQRRFARRFASLLRPLVILPHWPCSSLEQGLVCRPPGFPLRREASRRSPRMTATPDRRDRGSVRSPV